MFIEILGLVYPDKVDFLINKVTPFVETLLKLNALSEKLFKRLDPVFINNMINDRKLFFVSKKINLEKSEKIYRNLKTTLKQTSIKGYVEFRGNFLQSDLKGYIAIKIDVDQSVFEPFDKELTKEIQEKLAEITLKRIKRDKGVNFTRIIPEFIKTYGNLYKDKIAINKSNFRPLIEIIEKLF